MKRILILGTLAAIILTACEVHPYADFAVRDAVVQPGDAVYFTNLSERAVSYEWDFGDGTYSNNVDVVHTYSKEGTYPVTLTATSKDGNVDRVTIDIDVYYTVLDVIVTDIDNPQYVVTNAEVTLYYTLEDLDNRVNKVDIKYSNSNGTARFVGLDEDYYYVDISADDGYYWITNYFLGIDDVSYIETPVLQAGIISTFTAFVEFIPPGVAEQNDREKFESKIKSEKVTFIKPDVSK